LETIIKNSPNGLIEIGAGAGYWTSLLRERGLDVLAYDIAPPEKSEWTSRDTPFTEVIEGDHTNVVGKPERTLFVCWPERYGDYLHEMIELYEGDTIIYVGEVGGCTGDLRMHLMLGIAECAHVDVCDCPPRVFEPVERVEIPQWSGMHDQMWVLRRK
jgi:hypothetical protein